MIPSVLMLAFISVWLNSNNVADRVRLLPNFHDRSCWNESVTENFFRRIAPAIYGVDNLARS